MASFDFDFDQIRAGSPRSRGAVGGNITFSVTNDLTYDATGVWALDGSEKTQLFARITDQTTTDIIFDSLQLSLSTPDEEFTLGLEEGDNFNSLIGATTGALLAGHQYLFQFGYHIDIPSDAPIGDGGASASGFLSFNITPEPTCAVLLALGGVALLRRRRK